MEYLPLPMDIISHIRLYDSHPVADIVRPAIEKFNSLYEESDGICQECNDTLDERNNHWMVKYIYTMPPIVSSCKYSTLLCKWCVNDELRIGRHELNEPYYSHIIVRTRVI